MRKASYLRQIFPVWDFTISTQKTGLTEFTSMCYGTIENNQGKPTTLALPSWNILVRLPHGILQYLCYGENLDKEASLQGGKTWFSVLKWISTERRLSLGWQRAPPSPICFWANIELYTVQGIPTAHWQSIADQRWQYHFYGKCRKYQQENGRRNRSVLHTLCTITHWQAQ